MPLFRSHASRFRFWLGLGLGLLGWVGGLAGTLPAVAAPPLEPPVRQQATPTPEPRQLVVGSELDFPPFALSHANGTADGFTVELWRAVAQEAGLSYTIVVQPFSDILQGFKTGEVDVLINLAQSEARKEFADFSVPHVTVYGAIFVRQGATAITSEADLAGKQLIVLKADLAHDYAIAQGWEKDLVLVEDVASGFQRLSAGQSDAMLISKLVGVQTLQSLKITNVQPLPVQLAFFQKFSFAVRQGDAELLARINEGLALVKANGQYDVIYEKWFGVFETREVTLTDVLRVAAPYLLPGLVIFGVVLVAYMRQRQLTHQLALSTESWRQSESEVRQLNADLERRVQARTIDLEASNRELEAFAYSVAHDLRAPLRAIDGFSQALLEDYGAQLDEAGQAYLHRSRLASQRMGSMIDDLLALSRLNREAIHRTAVNLTTLAERVVADLRVADPARRVEVVITPDLHVHADASLARIVLENLLSNAWKFTQRTEAARIEVSVIDPIALPTTVVPTELRPTTPQPVFVVRDNGAGFNLAYADKLFGVFQRLHTPDEFPGTGVGLATVQRIIRRHDGHIWAWGQEGHGAAFYFTLAP